MKRWIKNIWDSTAIPATAEDRDEFVLLEDDPVGALLEKQRAAMSEDDNTPPAVENEPTQTMNPVEPELLPEDRKPLVPRENDPLQALAEEPVMVAGIDEEKNNPAEGSSLPASPEQRRTPIDTNNLNVVEGETVAAASPQTKSTNEANTESAREVTVMNTTEQQNQEAVPVNTADPKPMPVESTQTAPDEPVPDQVETEPEEIVNSEEDTEDDDSDSLLDIFKEEEASTNSLFSLGIEDISVDDLLDEANQVIKKMNTKRNK